MSRPKRCMHHHFCWVYLFYFWGWVSNIPSPSSFFCRVPRWVQALRGVGGIILNSEGLRFCNELGRGGSQRVGPCWGMPREIRGGRDETSDLPVFFWVLLKNGSFFFLVGFKRKIPHGFGYLKYFKSLELNLIVSFPMTMVKV